MYGLVIVSTIAQTMAGHSEAVNMISTLIVWRVLMGIGIGGDVRLVFRCSA